jgi:large subunit ribosomal protein L18
VKCFVKNQESRQINKILEILIIMIDKTVRRFKIKKRIRKYIFGTKNCPRLTVYRSNKQIYSQLIDDLTGSTLVSASSLSIVERNSKKKTAFKTGILMAQKAKQVGITSVIFDRNGYLYHGRVKEFASAARIEGLKF